MTDNDWESIDGWNNGEGQKWPDEESDIEQLTDIINKKTIVYEYSYFSEYESKYNEEEEDKKEFENERNTAENAANGAPEVEDEYEDEADMENVD